MPNPRRTSSHTNFAAKTVLIIGGTLALVAFCRHLYSSGWAGLQPFTSSGAAGEALVFVSLAAFFFAALGLGPTLRMAVAVGSVSLMAFLYAAELVLANTALGSGSPVPFWTIDRAPVQARKVIAALAAESGVTIDGRSRLEILDDSRQQGIEMVPAVMLADLLDGTSATRGGQSRGVTDELLPLGGISNTLTLLCNESGQFVSYASDEHGFRNPKGIWNSAHADIAAVGQSFTQGYCVPDGKGFVDLLRADGRVVLNLGTSGQSSLLQLGAIKEYLPRYAPKTVLWTFTEGIDLPDLYTESTHPFLMRYLEPAFGQELLARQSEIDHLLRRAASAIQTRDQEANAPPRPISFVERSLEIGKLWTLRKKLELSGEESHVWSMLDRPSHNLFSDALEQARTVTSSWGGTLYFVYLPSWSRYRNGPKDPERERLRVLRLVNALGIPIIDVRAAFEAQDDPLSLFPFRKFGHYNELGNQVVADTILKFLSTPQGSNAGTQPGEPPAWNQAALREPKR